VADVALLLEVSSKAESTAILVRVGNVGGRGANTTLIQTGSIVGIALAAIAVVVGDNTSIPEAGGGWAMVIAGGDIGESRARLGQRQASASNSLGIVSSGHRVPAGVASAGPAESAVVHEVVGHVGLVIEPAGTTGINEGTVGISEQAVG